MGTFHSYFAESYNETRLLEPVWTARQNCSYDQLKVTAKLR